MFQLSFNPYFLLQPVRIFVNGGSFPTSRYNRKNIMVVIKPVRWIFIEIIQFVWLVPSRKKSNSTYPAYDGLCQRWWYTGPLFRLFKSTLPLHFTISDIVHAIQQFEFPFRHSGNKKFHFDPEYWCYIWFRIRLHVPQWIKI